jgi:hypothetical protein
MICSLCSNIALRMVGKNGFCKLHRPEADLAARRENKNAQSRRGVLDALHWDTGRYTQVFVNGYPSDHPDPK